MPHHSKQSFNNSGGSNRINARHSFPPASSNLMMLSSTVQQTSDTTRTNWNAPPPHFHRVPQSPAEATKPIVHAPKEEVFTTTTTKHHDRELAASVLLLAAAATEESARMMQQARPLKKRKQQQCLSPMSPAHSTTTCTTAASTPQRSSDPVSVVDSQASSRTMSYEDVKEQDDTTTTEDDHEDEDAEDDEVDTDEDRAASQPPPPQTSNGSSKSLVTQQQQQPMLVEATTACSNKTSLPSMLYWLLTDTTSEQTSYIRTILQWLPHGQAWKIVRIDGLRRLIIPQFFTECLLEDGTASVDAFLMHLRAWGFEEIRDGPDIGAFAHTRFRRGYPQLCREMTFTPPQHDPHQRHAALLLRVPSLTSTESKDITTSPQSSFYGSTPPVFVNYRSEDVMRSYHSGIRSARGARRPNHPTVSTRGRRDSATVKRKLPLSSHAQSEL